MTSTATTDLFGQTTELPDLDAAERFASLVGLDTIKGRLLGEAEVLLDPTRIESWSERHHGSVLDIASTLSSRIPLVVLAGDVGTGKTELAETVGDPIARAHSIDVTMYPLSLNTRGQGLVGEMTSLITRAFDSVRSDFKTSRDPRTGRARHAGIIVIDEADALAQSRELAQMHHEDRAGVNALIRAVDGIRRDRLPILTIMCTNRGSALDPAVTRRAAHIFNLTRPDTNACVALLIAALAGASIEERHICDAAEHLGPQAGRPYGATYSDIRQRLIPDLFMTAYSADEPVTGSRLVTAAAAFEPTRPFANE